jgi:DUF1365 family protein
VIEAQFDKALHVSPFMGMDHRYTARAAAPGESLSVHISSRRAGELTFDATLALRRRPLTRASAASLTLRYPLATVRVLALAAATHALESLGYDARFRSSDQVARGAGAAVVPEQPGAVQRLRRRTEPDDRVGSLLRRG